MMRQAIHRDLDLGRHGLILVPYLGTVNFGDGDERFFQYHDEEATYLELKIPLEGIDSKAASK